MKTRNKTKQNTTTNQRKKNKKKIQEYRNSEGPRLLLCVWTTTITTKPP